MNKPQLTVCWVMAIMLSLVFFLSSTNIVFLESKGIPSPQSHINFLSSSKNNRRPTLDEIFGSQNVEKNPSLHVEIHMMRLLAILPRLVAFIPPILIIGGLLIYSLRNKQKPKNDKDS